MSVAVPRSQRHGLWRNPSARNLGRRKADRVLGKCETERIREGRQEGVKTMKVCSNCGSENVGMRDGENLCEACEKDETKSALARERRKQERNGHERAMRDLGLVKVRGACGGTYWE